MGAFEKIFGTHSERELKESSRLLIKLKACVRRCRKCQMKNYRARQRNLKSA